MRLETVALTLFCSTCAQKGTPHALRVQQVEKVLALFLTDPTASAVFQNATQNLLQQIDSKGTQQSTSVGEGKHNASVPACKDSPPGETSGCAVRCALIVQSSPDHPQRGPDHPESERDTSTLVTTDGESEGIKRMVVSNDGVPSEPWKGPSQKHAENMEEFERSSKHKSLKDTMNMSSHYDQETKCQFTEDRLAHTSEPVGKGLQKVSGLGQGSARDTSVEVSTGCTAICACCM